MLSLDPSLKLENLVETDEHDENEEFLRMMLSEMGQPSSAKTNRTESPNVKLNEDTSKAMTETTMKSSNIPAAIRSILPTDKEEAISVSEDLDSKRQGDHGPLDLKALHLTKEETRETLGDFLEDLEESVDFSRMSLTEGLTRLGITLKPELPPMNAIGVFGPSDTCDSTDEEDVEVLLAPALLHAPKTHGRKKGDKHRGGGDQKGFLNFSETDIKIPSIESDDDVSDGEQEYRAIQEQQFDCGGETSPDKCKTILEFFYGSHVPTLIKKYGFKASPFTYQQFDVASRHQLIKQFWILQVR